MEVSTAGSGEGGTRRGDGPAWRALAVLLFVALGFGCAVMIIAMVDIGGTPTCHDISAGKASIPADGQCFGGSGTQKAISLILGYPSGVIAAIAGLLALAYAITGRAGRTMLLLTAAAILLGVLSIGIGSV